jgi:hypothetical protein
MQWNTPSFVEINMNAEIGGYQSDWPGESEPEGPVTLPGFPDARAGEAGSDHA